MLRIASYNICKSVGPDLRRRPERILAVLAEIAADVVALQEADRRFGDRASTLPIEALEAEAGYRAVAFDRRPASLGWRGNALLVRPGIDVRAARALALPSLEPRGAVIADISAQGLSLRVACMHLGLTGAFRRRQARAVLQAATEGGEGPLVMMGDFNEWSALGGAVALLAHGRRVSPPMPSFHAAAPVAPLDRIVTSPDLAMLRFHVHASPAARRASDHLPVWADIAPAAVAAGAPSSGAAP
ncbi:MAG: endonuclease [Rhodobacteraceae bacterium]|nr:MAG: endonuclease [Paracoccaceae bacterium]